MAYVIDLAVYKKLAKKAMKGGGKTKIRRVRTPAGVAWFDQPIGSIIVADSKGIMRASVLRNKGGKGWRVTTTTGTTYDAPSERLAVGVAVAYTTAVANKGDDKQLMKGNKDIHALGKAIQKVDPPGKKKTKEQEAIASPSSSLDKPLTESDETEEKIFPGLKEKVQKAIDEDQKKWLSKAKNPHNLTPEQLNDSSWVDEYLFGKEKGDDEIKQVAKTKLVELGWDEDDFAELDAWHSLGDVESGGDEGGIGGSESIQKFVKWKNEHFDKYKAEAQEKIAKSKDEEYHVKYLKELISAINDMDDDKEEAYANLLKEDYGWEDDEISAIWNSGLSDKSADEKFKELIKLKKQGHFKVGAPAKTSFESKQQEEAAILQKLLEADEKDSPEEADEFWTKLQEQHGWSDEEIAEAEVELKYAYDNPAAIEDYVKKKYEKMMADKPEMAEWEKKLLDYDDDDDDDDEDLVVVDPGDPSSMTPEVKDTAMSIIVSMMDVNDDEDHSEAFDEWAEIQQKINEYESLNTKDLTLLLDRIDAELEYGELEDPEIEAKFESLKNWVQEQLNLYIAETELKKPKVAAPKVAKKAAFKKTAGGKLEAVDTAEGYGSATTPVEALSQEDIDLLDSFFDSMITETINDDDAESAMWWGKLKSHLSDNKPFDAQQIEHIQDYIVPLAAGEKNVIPEGGKYSHLADSLDAYKKTVSIPEKLTAKSILAKKAAAKKVAPKNPGPMTPMKAAKELGITIYQWGAIDDSLESIKKSYENGGDFDDEVKQIASYQELLNTGNPKLWKKEVKAHLLSELSVYVESLGEDEVGKYTDVASAMNAIAMKEDWHPSDSLGMTKDEYDNVVWIANTAIGHMQDIMEDEEGEASTALVPAVNNLEATIGSLNEGYLSPLQKDVLVANGEWVKSLLDEEDIADGVGAKIDSAINVLQSFGKPKGPASIYKAWAAEPPPVFDTSVPEWYMNVPGQSPVKLPDEIAPDMPEQIAGSGKIGVGTVHLDNMAADLGASAHDVHTDNLYGDDSETHIHNIPNKRHVQALLTRKLLKTFKIENDDDRKAIWASVSDRPDLWTDDDNKKQVTIPNYLGLDKNSGDVYPADGIDNSSSTVQYFEKGTKEYDELMMAHAVRTIISAWAGTSNNESSKALVMQEVAQEVFGIEDAAPWDISEKTAKAMSIRLATGRRFMEAFLRVQYEETQSELKRRGITKMRLYRGFKFYNGPPPQWIQDLMDRKKSTPILRPMSSFATDQNQAKAFASGSGIVIVNDTPAEKILGFPGTGYGCTVEHEVVVLGGHWHGIVPESVDLPDKDPNTVDWTAKLAAAMPEVLNPAEYMDKKKDELLEMFMQPKWWSKKAQLKWLLIHKYGMDPSYLEQVMPKMSGKP